MSIHTKTCGVKVKNGQVTIFHGQESITINPEDKSSVTLAEELVWKIRNEAQVCGENYAKKQIKDLLGITS